MRIVPPLTPRALETPVSVSSLSLLLLLSSLVRPRVAPNQYRVTSDTQLTTLCFPWSESDCSKRKAEIPSHTENTEEVEFTAGGPEGEDQTGYG